MLQITCPFGVPEPNKLEKHLILHLIHTLPTPQKIGRRHQHATGFVSSLWWNLLTFPNQCFSNWLVPKTISLFPIDACWSTQESDPQNTLEEDTLRQQRWTLMTSKNKTFELDVLFSLTITSTRSKTLLPRECSWRGQVVTVSQWWVCGERNILRTLGYYEGWCKALLSVCFEDHF